MRLSSCSPLMSHRPFLLAKCRSILHILRVRRQLMAFEVQEVQSTPNPNAIKFVLDRPIAPERLSFLDRTQADDHPLAARLFAINGVNSVMLLGDFVTVVKSPAIKWSSITGKVKKALSADGE